jgi:WD40 repeat protein
MEAPYKDVYALAIGPDGSLFAGGLFFAAGGVAAGNIARWDLATSSWHPLGSGMGGGVEACVYALVVGPDGSLYAGGDFTSAGGIAANYIARWDPATSSWHPLGSGMDGDYYPGVHDLAIGPDGSLYAGGNFTTAGGKPSLHIAQWTGAILRPAIWFPVVLMEQ